MKILKELCFIEHQTRKVGPISHGHHPESHSIVRKHHGMKTPGLTEASYNIAD